MCGRVERNGQGELRNSSGRNETEGTGHLRAARDWFGSRSQGHNWAAGKTQARPLGDELFVVLSQPPYKYEIISKSVKVTTFVQKLLFTIKTKHQNRYKYYKIGSMG